MSVRKSQLSEEQKRKYNEYRRQWRKNNPQKMKEQYLRRKVRPYVSTPREVAYRKTYYHANRDKALANSRKHQLAKNGWTIERFEELRIFGCAICGTLDGRLYGDHDHNTGKPRSVLCMGCNTAIGLMRESPEFLRKAALYIETWRIKNAL
jgi:hypothetical protein